jgi:hypothetical protein
MITEFEAFPKIPRLSRECIITEKIDGTNACVIVYDMCANETVASYPDEPMKALGPPPKDFPYVAEIEGVFLAAQSRSRFITPENDNHGFAAWVRDNAGELVHLGHGRHFGEYWGRGINRNYGLAERRFSLFNVNKWHRDLWERNERIRQERELQRFNHEVAKGRAPDPVSVRYFVTPPACCEVVPVLDVGVMRTSWIENILDRLSVAGSHAAPGFMSPEGIVIFHTAGGNLFKKTLGGDGAKGDA